MPDPALNPGILYEGEFPYTKEMPVDPVELESEI